MLKRKWLWMFGLLFAVMLAACGGNAPAATAVPVSQKFETSAVGGTVTLNYPDGWIANETNGQISVANSQAALDASSPAVGQFVVRMVVGPISAVSGLGIQSTAQDVIKFFSNSLSQTGLRFEDPTDLTVGSFSASRVQGSGSDGQATITAVNMGSGIFNVASAISANGEIGKFDATLSAILAAVTYAPDHPADTPADTPAATEASG